MACRKCRSFTPRLLMNHRRVVESYFSASPVALSPPHRPSAPAIRYCRLAPRSLNGRMRGRKTLSALIFLGSVLGWQLC